MTTKTSSKAEIKDRATKRLARINEKMAKLNTIKRSQMNWLTIRDLQQIDEALESALRTIEL